MNELERLADQVGQQLLKKQWQLVTAESCTGGWLAQVMTANAGSSQWFDCGLVTYSNQAKQQLLAVDSTTLNTFGAVSEPVALQMAEGALAHSTAQVAIAITGIAGPDGGTPSKPVGLVCFAVATSTGISQASSEIFPGDRAQIRFAAVRHALNLLLGLSFAT